MWALENVLEKAASLSIPTAAAKESEVKDEEKVAPIDPVSSACVLTTEDAQATQRPEPHVILQGCVFAWPPFPKFTECGPLNSKYVLCFNKFQV